MVRNKKYECYDCDFWFERDTHPTQCPECNSPSVRAAPDDDGPRSDLQVEPDDGDVRSIDETSDDPAVGSTTDEPIEGTVVESGIKRCPFCAEEILSAAIRCKHCRSDLPRTMVASPRQQTPARPLPQPVELQPRSAGAMLCEGSGRLGESVNLKPSGQWVSLLLLGLALVMIAVSLGGSAYRNTASVAEPSCESQPTDPNEQIVAIRRGCIDKDWFCENVSFEAWIKEGARQTWSRYGRAPSLSDAMAMQSVYLNLTGDAGCSEAQVMRSGGSFVEMLRSSYPRWKQENQLADTE